MMKSLRALSGRGVAVLALAHMGTLLLLWFLAPAVRWIAIRLGAPPTGSSGYPLLAGVIAYPSPFTWREALGAAIVFVPPAALILLWWLAQRRSPNRV